MRVTDTCGCFPTGRHYPGIAHLLLVRAAGLAEELDPDANWVELPIAFLDVETTGRDPATCRVIEVGVVLGRAGEIEGQQSWLVNPGEPIPAETTAIHGITDADVEGKPTFAEVLPELAAVLADRLPAAYNAQFDRSFILAEIERAGGLSDPIPVGARAEVQWLDPLVFARELFPGKQSRALGAMCTRLGIELTQAHRATADAEAALRVLYTLGKDPRVPTTYAALVREQSRLAKAQEDARRFWRK